MSAYRLFLITSGVAAFAANLAFTLNIVYQSQVVGLGPLQLVLVGTLMEAVCFVAQVPTGVLADLYGRRISVVTGYVLMGAGLLVWGLMPTYAAILVANVIWAVGAVCVDGAQEAWAADEIGEARIGQAFVRAGQLAQAGTALGIGAAAALAVFSLAAPIVVSGVITLMLGLGLAAAMPESGFAARRIAISPSPVEPCALRNAPGQETPPITSPPPALPGSPTPANSPPRAAWRSMRHQLLAGGRGVRGSAMLAAIMAGALFAGMSSEGFDRLSQPRFLADFGLSGSGALWFGGFALVAALGSVVATALIGRHVDAGRPRRLGALVTAVHTASAVAIVGFGLVGHFWVAVGLFLFATLLRTTAGPVTAVWLISGTTSGSRATVFSIQAQADALGLIAQRSTLGAGIVTSGLFLLPAAVLLFVATRHSPSHSRPLSC